VNGEKAVENAADDLQCVSAAGELAACVVHDLMSVVDRDRDLRLCAIALGGVNERVISFRDVEFAKPSLSNGCVAFAT
jgi:hypothetical protein